MNGSTKLQAAIAAVKQRAEEVEPKKNTVRQDVLSEVVQALRKLSALHSHFYIKADMEWYERWLQEERLL